MRHYDALIGKLSQDLSKPILPTKTVYLVTLGIAGFGVATFGIGGLLMAGNVLRPELPGLLAEPAVFAKHFIPLLIIVACLPLIVMFARPEAKVGHTVWPLGLAMLAMPFLFFVTLLEKNYAEWGALVSGVVMVQCAIISFALSCLLTAVQIAALRHGAVTHPRFAGLLVGIMSGAIGVSLYALFCVEDGPAFYGLWYSSAIFISGLVGLSAGRVWLRW